MEQKQEKVETVYQDISENEKPIEIESLCMNCEKNGITKLLLTRIPFFKEVILMCFECEHCGFKNTELQPGQALQDQGQKIILSGKTAKDLQREIVKSEYASIYLKELDFEMPANKKGIINTIEGLFTTAYEDLEIKAKKQLLENAELGLKLTKFLESLKQFLNGEILPFTLIIEDPSGNSFLQSFNVPNTDPEIKYEYFTRTKEQLELMGFKPENQAPVNEEKKDSEPKTNPPVANNNTDKILANRLNFSKPLTDDIKQEVQTFPVTCHSCFKEGVQKMCTIEIPYFKELIVMSFLCEYCGAHSTEVKPGGEISKQGKKITLTVKSDDELKRELFKSDSAKMLIPELELELDYGTLGSVYSTTEGLLEKISDNFIKNNPFCGDSEEATFKTKIDVFLKKLKMLRSGKQQFTLIFDDPLDNSFIQNPFLPKEDPMVKVEVYDRTFEQNEEFGLNDIKTENY